jgi:hypothetical protein
VSSGSIAPVGVENDDNFLPGTDEVEYKVALAGSSGPYRVVVEALYQSVGPSHTAAMDAGHSAEEATFLNLFQENNAPVVMARQELLVR